MKVIKFLLLFLVFVLFGFQVVQRSFGVFPQEKLIDVWDSTKCPVLTKDSYNKRAFQAVFEKYIEEKMGFRPTLIRLRNQFDYSVFNYTEANWVVIGKRGMLFTEPSIKNYLGISFKGEVQIKNEITRLKIIQDELKKHKVDFLLIFAPGKATFFHELIPDHFKQRPISNYQYYVKTLSGSGINFIDMNAWFRKLKGKTRYPLYPLNGSHWSSYGISLAADSMFRYIEKLKNIELPEFWCDQVKVSDSMRYVDNDIGELMNLSSPLKQQPMAYLHFSYKKERKTRPKVISIGDSYWLGFSKLRITENVFTCDNFWNYFRIVMVNNNMTGVVADVDIKKELFSQDLVILIVTESNYHAFPFGFIDGFFEKCMPDSPEVLQMLIEKYIVMIKNNPTWYQFVVDKARTHGHSIDEQLKMDAQYMIDQEQKK
jgi:SGNH hydrolase-like domain, acetyltransferase AlgX